MNSIQVLLRHMGDPVLFDSYQHTCEDCGLVRSIEQRASPALLQALEAPKEADPRVMQAANPSGSGTAKQRVGGG